MIGFSYLWLGRRLSCHWCGTSISRPKHRDHSPLSGTLDHLVPQAWGGRDEPTNLVLSCRGCNERRAAAGHCIAALRCAEAVMGLSVGSGEIRRFYRQFAWVESSYAIGIAGKGTAPVEVPRKEIAVSVEPCFGHSPELDWIDKEPTIFARPSNAPDLVGESFGSATVIGYAGSKNSVGATWVVACSCGLFSCKSTKYIRKRVSDIPSRRQCEPVGRIPEGPSISRDLGWTFEPLPTGPLTAGVKDLTGRAVGRLTVVGLAPSNGSGARWVVQCDCGRYGINRPKFLQSEVARRRAMCRACDALENPAFHLPERCEEAA